MRRIPGSLGGKAALALCAAGLAGSLLLGLWPLLPGGAGCVHGWLFSCEVVQHSEASRLMGIPLWAWGALWFALLAALVWRAQGRRGAVATLALTVAGWLMVAHLRGVELFVIRAACLLCWLVGGLALAAGAQPLWRSLGALIPDRRGIALATLSLIWIGGFFAAALRSSEPMTLPEIPGWEWVRAGGSPLSTADLTPCGPEVPTIVLIYDPSCADCDTLIAGPLRDEQLSLFLSEHCRVAVLLDEAIRSQILGEIRTTPAMILLLNGAVAAAVSGDVGEDQILSLVSATYAD
jgi:uncharacterized membrane protein